MKKVHQLSIIFFQTILIVSLFSIVNAQTASDLPTGAEAGQPMETVTPAPAVSPTTSPTLTTTPPANPDASIKITTLDGLQTPLSGIVYGCVELGLDDQPLFGESVKTDANGQIKWEVAAEVGHTYTCSAVSGYPDCLVPSSNEQKQVTVEDLQPGQNREYTFVWVFDPDQLYQNTGLTCKEAVDRGELAPVAGARLPAGFKVTPDISTLTMDEAKQVHNLTIEYTAASTSVACSNVMANNRIQWVDPVDISGDNMVVVFSTLNDYITLDQKGSINSTISSVPALAKTQKYYLSGLNFNLQKGNFPAIVIDGDYADLDKISDVGYSANTLSFSAKSGTIFAFRPTMEVIECNEDDILNGACTVTGKVDDVCATVVINVSGDVELNDSVTVKETGEFSYELTSLERGGRYNVNLTAKSVNLEKVDKSWTVGEGNIIDGISANAVVILGFLILIIGLIGLLWYKKHKKKHAIMAMSTDEQKEKARKLIVDVRSLSDDLKNEVGTLDLQDAKRVGQFQKVTEMVNSAAELEVMINVVDEEYDNSKIGEKLHGLEVELEDFRNVLVQEASVKKYAEQVQDAVQPVVEGGMPIQEVSSVDSKVGESAPESQPENLDPNQGQNPM